MQITDLPDISAAWGSILALENSKYGIHIFNSTGIKPNPLKLSVKQECKVFYPPYAFWNFIHWECHLNSASVIWCYYSAFRKVFKASCIVASFVKVSQPRKIIRSLALWYREFIPKLVSKNGFICVVRRL
ncbi:hypothetical protein D3C85_967090 [compost metagenome]